jgi:mannose-1-phosphate guanylyltransferase
VLSQLTNASNVYVVIMAGGLGERLFPLSSEVRPKQFIPLTSQRTMLQETVARVSPMIPLERILVCTNALHVNLVAEQLPDLPQRNIIPEKIARGTAACIGLVATLVAQFDPKAVMVVLPSDHVIEDQQRFVEILQRAIAVASPGEYLVCLGIEPRHPSSEYGYIEACELRSQYVGSKRQSMFSVKRFVEKPDHTKAVELLAKGNHYWNSGMFIWRVKTILNEIGRYMPQLDTALCKIAKTLPITSREALVNIVASVYEPLDRISIDYGVMEKSQRVLVVTTGDIGWSDVGGFEALRAITDRIEKPWGYEEMWALTDSYCGKILHVNAGESLSLQYHETKDETIRVLSGRLRLRNNKNSDHIVVQELMPGDRFHIPPGVHHQMEAIDDCDILEVSTPHILDVVRLEDRYGRVPSEIAVDAEVST